MEVCKVPNADPVINVDSVAAIKAARSELVFAASDGVKLHQPTLRVIH